MKTFCILFQLAFKMLGIQKTHLTPAYPLFVLTKEIFAQAYFHRRALDRLEAARLILFVFRGTVVTTELVVLSLFMSGWPWKKDSNSLNGSFWEGIKRYCLCDTNTTRKKTNFILPSYKSNSDELRFFCCLGFFFVCFWFFLVFFQKCFGKFPQSMERQKCYSRHKPWKRSYIALSKIDKLLFKTQWIPSESLKISLRIILKQCNRIFTWWKPPNETNYAN